jgi:two-component system chemotaxis sensor kinase CheA
VASFNATPEELQLFLAEAAEQLGEIERCLIGLEEGGDRAALITELFRQAHSLKGSAGAIGHERMARLAHALESALERHRSGGVAVSAADADTYLGAVDALGTLTSELVDGTTSGIDVDECVARLASAARVEAPAPATRLHVTFRPDTPLVVVRAIQVVMLAPELGTLIASQPALDALERGEFEDQLELHLRTERGLDEVIAAIKGVEAVAEVDIVLDDAPVAEAQIVDDPVVPALSGQPPAAGEAERAGGAGGRGIQTVRIDVARLDALMALVGELVIDRTRIAQIAGRLEGRYGGDGAVEELVASAGRLERISTDLQSEVMKSRLLPVDTVFSRFPRLVRDVARRLGKEVHLEISGRETELDRSVIEDVADPLVHLIRNAIDHGLETPEVREAAGKPRAGTVRLSARHEESYIVVEVEDDGRGIDPAAVAASAIKKGLVTEDAVARMSEQECVDLIFTPGFSLASGVTDLSGRGVGMDVVRSNVQRLKGSVAIHTVKGEGTRVVVKLPLTLAILRALLVSVAGRPFAIPLVSVVETLRIARTEMRPLNGSDVVRLRGDILPLVWLDRTLRLTFGDEARRERVYVVAAQQGARRVGLIVDGLLGEQEIVVKPIGALAGDAPGIAGATILGDGRVAPILDVSALMEESGSSRTHEAALAAASI